MLASSEHGKDLMVVVLMGKKYSKHDEQLMTITNINIFVIETRAEGKSRRKHSLAFPSCSPQQQNQQRTPDRANTY